MNEEKNNNENEINENQANVNDKKELAEGVKERS